MTMKRYNTLKISFILLAFQSNLFAQTTYYVSEQNGNDNNDGLSQQTAWKTLQNLPTNFSAGSSVLFEKGGSYRGEISYNNHKADGVTFSSYGNGNLPQIKGSIVINGWTPTTHPSLNSNVYEADVSNLNYDLTNGIQHLFVNNKIATIARYPNVDHPKATNWLNVDATGGTKSFTDADLAAYGKPNGYWVGATLRIRKYSWTFLVDEITGYNSATGEITANLLNNQLPGWGYFIDGKLEELDYPGEWYFDEVAKKVYYYPLNGQNPNNLLIEGATYDVGIFMNACDNVTIQGLAFEQFLDKGIRLSFSNTNTIAECLIRNNETGAYLWKCSDLTFRNCEFYDNNGNSVVCTAPTGTNPGVSEFKNNLIKNSGMLPGYGERYTAAGYSDAAIQANFPGYYYLENIIDSCGWAGFYSQNGGGAIIKNNIITNAILVSNDAGAIYLGNGTTNNVVDGNIMLNSYGNIDEESNGYANGSSQSKHHAYGMGLATDGNATNSIIINNTIANNSYWGIRMKNMTNTRVSNNVVYNNSHQIVVEDHPNFGPSSGNTVTSNVCYTLTNDQIGLEVQNRQGNTAHGYIDSNYYGCPYNRAVIKNDGIMYSYNHFKNSNNVSDTYSKAVHHRYNQYNVNTVGNNELNNSTFDVDVSSWSPSDPTKLDWLPSYAQFNGGVLQAKYPAIVNSSTNLIPNTFSLQSGVTYRVRLSGTSSDNATVRVRLNDVTSGTTILEQHYFAFNQGVKSDYEFYYTPDANYSSVKMIISVINVTTGDVVMDNIYVEEITGTPASAKDSSVLFINYTNQIKTVNLGNAVFEDLDGNTVTGNFNLDPFRSRVLLYISGTYTGIKEEVDNGIVKMFPNPTHGMVTIAIKEVINEPYQVKVYSMLGQELMNEKINTPIHRLNMQNLDKGTYIITVLKDNKIVQSDRMILLK